MEPLTRAELLQVLPSLGVEIPADTRLPDGVLQARLRAALDAAQYKDHLPASLDWNALPEWPLLTPEAQDAHGRSVLEAFRRGNMDEARQIVEGTLPGILTHTNAFMEGRKIMQGIAQLIDTGIMWWLVKDPDDDKRAINIRVVSVLQVDEKTPALVVLYRHFDRSTAAESTQWTHQQADKNPSAIGKNALTITASPVEQKILTRILKENAALLPSKFKVDKRSTERSFHVSVLLPIGPLEYEALAKLNSKETCAVCGRNGTNRCSRCQSASYCGADCQRADWPRHRDECQAHSLRDARWLTITTRATPFSGAMEGMHMSTLNKHSNINLGFSNKTSATSKIDLSNAPPNEHGDRLFLIKMQGGMPGMGPPVHFMIYDRKRSFQSFMLSRDDRPQFREVLTEMTASPRVRYDGCKMYRWARRTGDWELSICLDREPRLEACNW